MNGKKIQDILNVFQEGVFEEFNYSDGNLNFKIECKYLAELINKNYIYFYGVIKCCDDFYFHPWEEGEDGMISSSRVIASLKPDVLSAEMVENGYVKIYSNCHNTFSGGNIFILGSDIKIFDEDFIEYQLPALEELSEQYWCNGNEAEG